MPGNRFETPEVAGRNFGFSLDTGVAGNQRVRLVKADLQGSDYVFAEERSIVSNPTSQRSFRMGFLEQFEAVVRVPWDSPVLGGVKWQFHGGSRKENTQGWKLALAAYGGQGDMDNFADKSDMGNSYSSDLEVIAGEINLLAGYRVSEKVLWYANSSYAWYDVDGRISDRGADTVVTNGWAQQIGQALGMELRVHMVRFKLEAALMYGNYRNDVVSTNGLVGGSVGVYF